MSTLIFHTVTDSELSTERRYTSQVPSSHDWYMASHQRVILNTAHSEEEREAVLREFRCEWDFSYKTVRNLVEVNMWPYSYKVLSEEAIQRLTRESSSCNI